VGGQPKRGGGVGGGEKNSNLNVFCRVLGLFDKLGPDLNREFFSKPPSHSSRLKMLGAAEGGAAGVQLGPVLGFFFLEETPKKKIPPVFSLCFVFGNNPGGRTSGTG